MPHHDTRWPTVAPWRIVLLRLLYAAIALIMGSFVWRQILFESADWDVMRGLAKAMLAALALLSLWGVRYPLQMLPLMLFELAWKTIWLTLIALPAWRNGHWTPDIEALFYDCIGIVVLPFIMPWNYVWARYVRQPAEAWWGRDNRATLMDRN